MNAAQWQQFLNQTVDRSFAPLNRISERRIMEQQRQKEAEAKLENYRKELELKMSLAPQQAEIQRKLEAQKLGLPEDATWEQIFKKGQEVELRRSLAPAQYRALQNTAALEQQKKIYESMMKSQGYYLQKAYEQLPIDKPNPNFDLASKKLAPEEIAQVTALATELMKADQERAVARASLVGPSAEQIQAITNSIATGTPYTMSLAPQQAEIQRKLEAQKLGLPEDATWEQIFKKGQEGFLDDEVNNQQSAETLMGEQEEPWRGIAPYATPYVNQTIANVAGFPVDAMSTVLRSAGVPVGSKPFGGSASIKSGMQAMGIDVPQGSYTNSPDYNYWSNPTNFAEDTLQYTLFGVTPNAEQIYGRNTYQPTAEEDYASTLMGQVRDGSISREQAMAMYSQRYPNP